MPTELRVACVTTSRSEYGPSYWLFHDLFADSRFEPLLIVGGAHLSARYGHTVDEIVGDGWPIAERLAFLGDADTIGPAELASALALHAAAFLRQRPDVVLLHGDRLELLPIATAALVAGCPIAHVAGGEVTAGAVDDQVRHAVTKLSHVHFATHERAAARLRQMGEETWRVHVTGDPALDHFRRGTVADPAELGKTLGFVPDASTLLVTLHPETLAPGRVADDVLALSTALAAHDGWVVITAPAPDPGAELISRAWRRLAGERSRTVLIDSLGSFRYRGLLAVVGALVGNSSSGLIEASMAGVPAVNIGRRQEGRTRGGNVVDVEPLAVQIADGIRQALSSEWRERARRTPSPYGDGAATPRILAQLAALPSRVRLLAKAFVDR